MVCGWPWPLVDDTTKGLGLRRGAGKHVLVATFGISRVQELLEQVVDLVGQSCQLLGCVGGLCALDGDLLSLRQNTCRVLRGGRRRAQDRQGVLNIAELRSQARGIGLRRQDGDGCGGVVGRLEQSVARRGFFLKVAQLRGLDVGVFDRLVHGCDEADVPWLYPAPLNPKVCSNSAAAQTNASFSSRNWHAYKYENTKKNACRNFGLVCFTSIRANR